MRVHFIKTGPVSSELIRKGFFFFYFFFIIYAVIDEDEDDN